MCSIRFYSSAHSHEDRYSLEKLIEDRQNGIHQMGVQNSVNKLVQCVVFAQQLNFICFEDSRSEVFFTVWTVSNFIKTVPIAHVCMECIFLCDQ